MLTKGAWNPAAGARKFLGWFPVAHSTSVSISMKDHSLLVSFLSDIIAKLRWRFFALVGLTAICAVTDGLRMLVAFMLLPFIGFPLAGQGVGLLRTTHDIFETVGVPYNFEAVALVVTVVFTVQAGLSLMQSWYHGAYPHYYTLLWRQELFRSLARARWRYFLDANRGELTNVLAQETGRLASATAKVFLFLSNLLIAIAYVAASFLLSIEATLLMSVAGLIVVIFNSLVMKRLMSDARQIVKGNNQMMVVAQQFFNNIKTIKAAPRHYALEAMFAQPLRTIFRSERSAYLVSNASRIAAELFIMLALILGITSLTGWGQHPASSELLLVLVLFLRTYGKITLTMTLAQQLYVLLPAFEYIEKLKRQTAEEEEALWHSGIPITTTELEHGIRFEEVSVVYGGGEKTALKSLTVFLPPRSIVALVGSSGAGKTTFVDTLLRLVDVEAGRISVNGRDAREFNVQSWRACFGYVSQDLTLLSGTLAENIKLFKPGATDEEVRVAATLAHAHDFIESLSNGYDTQVGEMGLKLSGGQRQRIALARALINDPPVLILDEATSALDSESEAKVMEAVYEMRKGKTVILIAHRLSTVRDADIILVLEDGSLVEQGNWEFLVRKGGRITALWQRLSGDAVVQNAPQTDSGGAATAK